VINGEGWIFPDRNNGGEGRGVFRRDYCYVGGFAQRMARNFRRFDGNSN
jgi:hypothetical protein